MGPMGWFGLQIRYLEVPRMSNLTWFFRLSIAVTNVETHPFIVFHLSDDAKPLVRSMKCCLVNDGIQISWLLVNPYNWVGFHPPLHNLENFVHLSGFSAKNRIYLGIYLPHWCWRQMSRFTSGSQGWKKYTIQWHCSLPSKALLKMMIFMFLCGGICWIYTPPTHHSDYYIFCGRELEHVPRASIPGHPSDRAASILHRGEAKAAMKAKYMAQREDEHSGSDTSLEARNFQWVKNTRHQIKGAWESYHQ